MSDPETKPQNPPEENKTAKKQLTKQKTLIFAVEFGFMIALPLVVFGFLGKWLSVRYHNPLYSYGGILLALLTSIIWFWKKIIDIYNDYIN